jgi:hypothetical protein
VSGNALQGAVPSEVELQGHRTQVLLGADTTERSLRAFKNALQAEGQKVGQDPDERRAAYSK